MVNVSIEVIKSTFANWYITSSSEYSEYKKSANLSRPEFSSKLTECSAIKRNFFISYYFHSEIRDWDVKERMSFS